MHVLHNRKSGVLFLVKPDNRTNECFQLKCLQIFLSCSADIQAVDEDGNTPLLWAVYKGNSKAVLLLLRAGASVGFPDAEVGRCFLSISQFFIILRGGLLFTGRRG